MKNMQAVQSFIKGLLRTSQAGLVVGVLLGGSVAAQNGPAFRSWTSTDGRVVEAVFVSLEGESVRIRNRSGMEFVVAMNRLSSADQQWARAQAQMQTSSSGGVTSATLVATQSPPAERVWPRMVALEDKPEVVVVREDAAKKEFVYRSPHYEFVCDSRLGANVVREFGRLFEATFLLNCKLPLDLKPKPEPLREFFQARLFTNEEDYYANGGVAGSAGVYSRGDKALKVPLKSLGVKMVGTRVSLDKTGDDDNATLIHEITHQMMNHWLRALPTWYTEGSAEYAEMLEYMPSGRFTLSGMRGRLEQYVARCNLWQTTPFKMLDLKELMEIESGEWQEALTRPVQVANVSGATQASQNYGSAGLLTYYFYHHDGNGDAANLIAYLREIEAAAMQVDESALARKHLLRERTYAQLAEDVKRALKKDGVQVEFDDSGKNGGSSLSQ